MSTITILIVDDHALMRQGLRQICETMGGFTVMGEALNGHEAMHLAHELRPDVILMDMTMPGTSGIYATHQIMQANPAARIIALSMHQQEDIVIDAVKAGIRGYLSKNVNAQTLITTIEAVARGDFLIEPMIALKVLNEMRQAAVGKRDHNAVVPLTASEMAVLRLVAQGVDNDLIAQKMTISMHTVANRLRSIYEKLHVNNRTQAALYALRHGWVDLEEPLD
ncbi:MAG: response regulator transcription factor [Caldilineaceae bacterium]|nr:response regulator transcription factor [Caldilineaceae bacterium]